MLDYFSKNNNSRSLQIWLYRLRELSEFKHPEGSNKRSIKLIEKVIDYLNYAEENLEFRDVFSAQIFDAAATCGDRIALSVLKLGIEYAISSESKKIIENPFHPLKPIIKALRTRIIFNFLEKIAEEKMKTMKFVDDVETYLAYPILLRKRLHLKLDIKEMLYPKCSGLSEIDIDHAETHIKGVIGSGLAELLLKEREWEELLKLVFKEKYEQLLNDRTIGLENDMDANVLLIHFNSELKKLTKQLLSPIHRSLLILREKLKKIKTDPFNHTLVENISLFKKITNFLNKKKRPSPCKTRMRLMDLSWI